VSYSRSNPSDIQVLFDVLTVLISPSPVDFTFLKKFLCDEVARTWTPENKKGLLFFFLRMLSDVSLASDIKVLALRFIVTPTLVSALSNANCMLGDEATGGASSGRGCDMFDNDLVALFMRSALDITDHSTHCHSEALRVELLKLTTVLIEHLGLQLVEHRKELIKFAWNHLKSDDSLSKQWAYVNVCRFIATYETPPKIILQVGHTITFHCSA
jgi:transformation/transcription domain-associated protein